MARPDLNPPAQLDELRAEYVDGDHTPEGREHLREKIADLAERIGDADAFDHAVNEHVVSERPLPPQASKPTERDDMVAAWGAINTRILESIQQGAGVPEAYAIDRDILERRINALNVYRRVGI